MNDPHIDITVNVEQEVDTTVHVSDVIYALNRIPMPQRWNAVASILKHIELDESKLDDKKDALTDKQRGMVLDFLNVQIMRFKVSEP